MTNPPDPGETVTIEPTPVWDALLADLGQPYAQVDTEWTVLESQAICAMVERAP